jgi:flagellar basal-body rod protein FlgB
LAPNFATELQASIERGDLSKSAGSIQPALEEDPHARSVRPDGNSVEIESELLEMNKNSTEQEYLSNIVTYDLKQLKMAITGTVSPT